MEPWMISLILKLNISDKKKIKSLIKYYRVTATKLFKCQCEKYQTSLLLLSKNILPKEVDELLLNFAIESEKKAMMEIEYAMRGNKYLEQAKFFLVIQAMCITLMLSVGLDFTQSAVRNYYHSIYM